MMTYKGYIAVVEYDDQNKILVGSVINTRTVITFQADRASDLEKEFHESVDDYIAWCEEDGIEPERPYSGRFNVRLKPEMHQRAAVKAKLMGLSLNGFVEKAIEDELMEG